MEKMLREEIALKENVSCTGCKYLEVCDNKEAVPCKAQLAQADTILKLASQRIKAKALTKAEINQIKITDAEFAEVMDELLAELKAMKSLPVYPVITRQKKVAQCIKIAKARKVAAAQLQAVLGELE